MDLSFCMLNFSLTVFVKIAALLIMQTDHLNFVCWSRAACSRELRPIKWDHKIDLQFLNINKFSNYKRLLNMTAIVLIFIKNLKKRLNREKKGYVTAGEYSKAEHL